MTDEEKRKLRSDILARIDQLILDHDLTRREFCASIDAAESCVTDWHRRGMTPNAATLYAISKTYHISLDYLVSGRNAIEVIREGSAASDREREFLRRLRTLPPELQDMVASYMDGMIQTLKKSQQDEIAG